MKTRTKQDGTKQVLIANTMWIDVNETVIPTDKETSVFKD